MDKIGIIYFSGTGNTKYIVNHIKDYIDKNYGSCALINIENDIINTDYSSIIIAGPVYIERYPEILFKFIERNLRDYTGNCMLLTTAGADQNITSLRHAEKRLSFLNITYCVSIMMPNNFSNIMFPRPSKEQIDNLLSSSYQKCDVAVKEFLSGQVKRYKIRPVYSKLIDMTYNMFYPHFSRRITSKISIDKDKCIKCRLCERNCPVKSINIDRDNLYDDNCMLCQRCMNSCPKDAFLYKGKEYTQYMPKYKEMGK